MKYGMFTLKSLSMVEYVTRTRDLSANRYFIMCFPFNLVCRTLFCCYLQEQLKFGDRAALKEFLERDVMAVIKAAKSGEEDDEIDVKATRLVLTQRGMWS